MEVKVLVNLEVPPTAESIASSNQTKDKTEKEDEVTQAAPPSLARLPALCHIEIFKHLHRVDSTCLGLTCQLFYTIHRKLHGSVGLGEWDMGNIDSPQLHDLLKTWMGSLVWGGPWTTKFITKQRISMAKKIFSLRLYGPASNAHLGGWTAGYDPVKWDNNPEAYAVELYHQMGVYRNEWN